MPLMPGSSNKVVSQNIKELSHSSTPRPQAQIIAIALAKKRESLGKAPPKKAGY